MICTYIFRLFVVNSELLCTYCVCSITKKKLNVPEKPKLKCLGFTYNGAKLFNMLPIKLKIVEDPSAFKTMTKEWIWENIPSY